MQDNFRDATGRSGVPYIWVTWMTKLISGEAKCDWSLWFRSRHNFDKLDSGFDLKQWTIDHDQLVAWRSQSLRKEGIITSLEREMLIEGATATISGKADIYYAAENVTTFEDCKTGKRRDSDHVQVLLYIWLHSIRRKTLHAGKVVYKDGVAEVDVSRLESVERDALRLIRLSASEEPAGRHPSPTECRSCNIASFYCEERQHSPGREIIQTDAF